MAETIGLLSGLAGLATFAFQSSVALYETITSYQSHHQRVRDLAEENAALSGILGSLTDTIRASSELDLSALEIPLRRCGKACQDFEKEIKKCSLRSGGARTSFRDWAKLQYMGEDIDSFRRRLAEYKMTITIALTDANLRQSTISAESIEGYKQLLNTAQAGLEERLESIDEKLDMMLPQAVSGSESTTSDLRQIKEERLSTEKCLQICAQLSEHISQIQLTEMSSSTYAGANNQGSVPEQITSKGLQDCKNSLSWMTKEIQAHEEKLFRRLMAKMNMNDSETETAEMARLKDEWESTREQMNILSKASQHLESSVSVIENHATGDAVQFMVSTNGKALHGTNRGLGWRTRQMGGYVSNETVQKGLQEMMSIRIRREAGGVFVSMASDQEGIGEEKGPSPGFTKRYGEGFQL